MLLPGLIILVLLIVGFFLLQELIKVIISLVVAIQGPFYGVTTQARLKQLIKLAKLKPGQKVVDLGSGDGRVLIALAKAFPQAKFVGYEINPLLVAESRHKITQAGLADKIKIYSQSFWQLDLSKFDLIVVFCTAPFMARLGQKISQERQKHTRVLSVYFKFPNLEEKHRLGDIGEY